MPRRSQSKSRKSVSRTQNKKRHSQSKPQRPKIFFRHYRDIEPSRVETPEESTRDHEEEMRHDERRPRSRRTNMSYEDYVQLFKRRLAAIGENEQENQLELYDAFLEDVQGILNRPNRYSHERDAAADMLLFMKEESDIPTSVKEKATIIYDLDIANGIIQQLEEDRLLSQSRRVTLEQELQDMLSEDGISESVKEEIRRYLAER